MREQNLGPPHGDLGPSLPRAMLDRLAEAGEARRFARQDTIYRQGDAAHFVCLLVSGRVKASSVNALGDETVLRVHLPDSLLGLTAIGRAPRRDATAEAIEPSELRLIPRARMLDLMRADADLGIYIAQLLLERLSSFQYRVHEVMANTVEQRLARALLEFGSRGEDDPARAPARLTISHEELASIVAARRPTVTQALRAFAEAGLVRLERRCIVVLDAPGLERRLPRLD